MVQGGQTSPGHYAITSLYFVRGIKKQFKTVVQVVVADDGLMGVPRADLLRLMTRVVEMYEEIYMEVDLTKKTKVYGVAGQGLGQDREVQFRGQAFKVEWEVMEHLGASLPLQKQAAATDKAKAKLESVKQCWEEGEDIPVQVLVQQFQAQVLGALRHQQQAARLPHGWEEERRKEFEGLVRKKIRLGASLPSAYLQAPPPGGIGLGNISLQGAVDFLAGSGQLRYAPNEVRASVLQEIEQQAIQEGICPCTLVPQHGPWEKGRQTILQDLLRSWDEVGAIALMGGERRCRRKGPVIARAGYGPRRQREMRGVKRSEWGGQCVA